MSQILQQSRWLRRTPAFGAGWKLGVVLCLLSIPVIQLNERRVIQTAKTLDEVDDSVVPLLDGAVDPRHEGRLVRVSGVATTEDELTDKRFGVSVNALRLYRKVETYQWREDAHRGNYKTLGNDEGQTEFTYRKVWSSRLIDSRKFRHPAGHQNSVESPFEDRIRTAKNLRLADFALSAPLGDEFYADRPLRVSLQHVPLELKRNLSEYSTENTTNGFIWSRWAMGEGPQVGDVRITFWYSAPTVEMTVLAAQVGNHLAPYTTKDGQQLFQLSKGLSAGEPLVSPRETEEAGSGWLWRIVGLLMMFSGLQLLLRPLARVAADLAEVWPPIGNLLRLGIPLLSALLAGLLCLTMIGLTWLLANRLWGLAFLAAAGGLLGLLYLRMRIPTVSRTIGRVAQETVGDSPAAPSKNEQTLGA